MTTLEILALQNIAGYGPTTVRKIVGMAESEVVDSAEGLLDLVNSYEATKKKPSFKTLEEIKRALWKAGDLLLLSQEKGIQAVSYLDKDFPKNLSNVTKSNAKVNADVPLVLFYRGDIKLTQKKTVAIIGTRKPTEEGRREAHYFGKIFAQAGYNILNGMEVGCDTAALEGALEVGRGTTTVLVPHSLDTNSNCASKNSVLEETLIENGGLILSKYPLGEKVNRCSLLSTSRLQATLADATIVIKSRAKGSTLYSAMAALKLDKPVFCVDFRELDSSNKQVQGNELLVAEGACYLENGKDPVRQVEEAISNFVKNKTE